MHRIKSINGIGGEDSSLHNDIIDFDSMYMQVGCEFKQEAKQVATAAQTELWSSDDVMICTVTYTVAQTRHQDRFLV